MFSQKAPLPLGEQTDEQYKEVAHFVWKEGNALMSKEQQQSVMKAWKKEPDQLAETQAYLRANFRRSQRMSEEESKQFQMLLANWSSNKVISSLDVEKRKSFSYGFLKVPDLIGCYRYLLEAAIRPGNHAMQTFMEKHWALGYYNEALQICQAYIAIELRNKESAPKPDSFIYQFIRDLVSLAESKNRSREGAAAPAEKKADRECTLAETVITSKDPILFVLIIYQTFCKEINSKLTHTIACDLAIKYSYPGFAGLALAQIEKMNKNKKEMEENRKRCNQISELFKQKGMIEQKPFAGSVMSFFVPAECITLPSVGVAQVEQATQPANSGPQVRSHLGK